MDKNASYMWSTVGLDSLVLLKGKSVCIVGDFDSNGAYLTDLEGDFVCEWFEWVDIKPLETSSETLKCIGFNASETGSNEVRYDYIYPNVIDGTGDFTIFGSLDGHYRIELDGVQFPFAACTKHIHLIQKLFHLVTSHKPKICSSRNALTDARLKTEVIDYVLYRISSMDNSRKEGYRPVDLQNLVFFICAASCTNDNGGLFRVFSDWKAVPYGYQSDFMWQLFRARPVRLLYYTADTPDSIFRTGRVDLRKSDYDNVPNWIKTLIDASVNKIDDANKEFFSYPFFSLVDLAHSWYSWKTAYGKAKIRGVHSNKVMEKDVVDEMKVYTLW